MATRNFKVPLKPSRKGVSHTPSKQKPKDPVEVYCRVRPLKQDENESCAEVMGMNILQLTPPECSLAYKSGHRNGTQHLFKKVFNTKTTQKEMFDQIAFPLVEDLILGKNSLLFAYGVTNSGKTYTMSGEPDQPGILPRIMDVLFNSVADVQTPKYVFRPDQANGFNVFTESEARLEQNKKKPKKISPRARSELPEFGDQIRVPEQRRVSGIDEDNSYSVFISYAEIYNNFVYDLLDESNVEAGLHPKAPTSKIMREDTDRNMYISGVTEVEVMSTEEAYDVLIQGQRKRRVAHTQLNHDSSRSHAVFNIRLVQTPLDPTGAEVLQDRSKVACSQLSLVDLAGSERVARTCNGGDRLREAGSINQSLMVLRNCMETLRDNQRTGLNKLVPYRDSKLTHLFKNYFDGEGKVRMIVCISPRAEDYDESIHVMKFAEVTQEVVVDRPSTTKVDVGLAPGRRRANIVYQAAMKDATSILEGEEIESTPVHPYQIALGMICLQQYITDSGCTASSLSELKQFLEKRQQIREQLTEDLKKKQLDFRSQLVTTEQELMQLRVSVRDYSSQRSHREKAQREVSRLKGIITSQEKQIVQLTSQLDSYKQKLQVKEKEYSRINDHLARVTQQNDYLLKNKQEYENQLTETKRENEHHIEQTNVMQRQLKGRVTKEREKFEQLAQQMEMKELECHEKDQKLYQVRELIRNSPLAAARSNPNTPFKHKVEKENRTKPGQPPLYNKAGKGNRKRSLSENWLEHNPVDTVNNGDLLQPNFKKKKTVTNPKSKHFNLRKVDKYVLKHQEQDSAGEVKTELYKGEILQTRTGGASVKFTDIEKLNHASPMRPTRRWTRSMSRKANARSPSSSILSSSTDTSVQEGEWTDVETRCAVGIEGKPGTTPAFSHIAIDKRQRIN